MLGKLMKYEWQSTWKLLLPANLLIVVMTFFACITINMGRSDLYDITENEGILFGAIMILVTYIGSMFGVMIGTAIYLIYRFYTSTYGDQGYLLHTLPVDKHHIIIAKASVSTAWVLLSSFLIYLSVLFIFASDDGVIPELIDSMESLAKEVGGRPSFFAGIMTLIAYVISVLARVLKVTACLSLGQLSANHKLLMSFAYYFGIYFLQQMIGSFYYAFLGLVNSKLDTYYYGQSWEVTLIAGLVYVVIFYAVTWYTMDKRLNLD